MQENIKLLLGIMHTKYKIQMSKDVNIKVKIKYFIRKCRNMFMTLVVKGLKYKC